MNTCPPELHSYICELACLDDGRTSRALALVSRYFRDISSPFLYQSIALTGGLAKISILTSQLERLTPSQFRPLRHLFISDRRPQSGQSPQETFSGSPQPTAALNRLIAFAAPTLETLSIVLTNHAQSTPIFARLFRTYFPRLRELSISGFYPFPSASSSLSSQSPQFPTLTHLHLHGNRNPHGLLHLDALSDTVCPSLTHLRISGLSMAVSFASELRTALFPEVAVSEPPNSSPPSRQLFEGKLPTRIERVLVQPGPEQRTKKGARTEPHAKETTMMAQLEIIRASARLGHRSGPEFCLLPRNEGAGVSDLSFRKDWEGRLTRGEGCWALT